MCLNSPNTFNTHNDGSNPNTSSTSPPQVRLHSPVKRYALSGLDEIQFSELYVAAGGRAPEGSLQAEEELIRENDLRQAMGRRRLTEFQRTFLQSPELRNDRFLSSQITAQCPVRHCGLRFLYVGHMAFHFQNHAEWEREPIGMNDEECLVALYGSKFIHDLKNEMYEFETNHYDDQDE